MDEVQPLRFSLRVRLVLAALCGFCVLLCGCHGNRGSVAPRITARLPSAPIVPAAPSIALTPRPTLFEATRHAPHKVALTFDAGADDRAVPLLLKTLQAHHVHATFFLTGKFAERYPRSCRALADAGMEIGNHSYSHPHFTKLTKAAIVQQLERAEAAITRACGRGAKPLFRFPFGDCDRRTIRIVAAAGYQPIGWTIDSLDSVGKPKSPQFIANRINRRVRSGAITLCHVSMIRSAKALPAIFAHLDRQGDQVVPVSELLTAARSVSRSLTVAARH